MAYLSWLVLMGAPCTALQRLLPRRPGKGQREVTQDPDTHVLRAQGPEGLHPATSQRHTQ